MRTCSLPRAPTTLQRRGSRCAVVTASTTPGLLNRLLNWQPGSGGPGGAVGAARRQLREQLSSRKPDAASIGEACDALMAAEVPFREADLGGGPFQVAYTRGPLLWALSPSSGGRVSSPTGNQVCMLLWLPLCWACTTAQACAASYASRTVLLAAACSIDQS